MTQVLPNGLVSNTSHISSELRGTSHVDIEDIAKLWRVYTTNKTTLKEDAGRRLENLFWRIWSNKHIRSSIQGSTLAGLFVHISDRASIREDYPGKNKNSTENGSANISHGYLPGNSTPKSSPLSKTQGGNPGSYKPCNQPSNGVRTPLPPSILKKPRQPSEASSVSSKGFSVDAQDKSLNAPSSLSGSYQSHSGRRKKTTFATNLTSSQEEVEGFTAFGNTARPRSGSGSNQGRYANIRSPGKSSPFSSQLLIDKSIPEVSTNNLFASNFTLNNHANLLSPPRSDPYANQSQSPASKSKLPLQSPSQACPTLNALSPLQSQPQSRSQSSTQSQLDSIQPQRQPSTASLVDKNFRARFAEKRLSESRVSSLSNLIVEREPHDDDDDDDDYDDYDDDSVSDDDDEDHEDIGPTGRR